MLQALSLAMGQRQPAARRLRPTDRGSPDGADSSRQRLAQHGRQASRSRQGNGWANAVAERFLHPLKTAWLSLEDYGTHDHAPTAVGEYIAVFSNRQRCHAAHGSFAPLADEQALKTNGSLCPEKG